MDKNSQEQEWKEKLTPEQYEVLRQKGTEAPFSGKYVDMKDDGMYVCAACGEPLFLSNEKFDSGSGWPSFFKPASDTAIETEEDRSHFMVRTEVKCKKCGGHLGHVFSDAPKEKGGLRYCINSGALDFKPSEGNTTSTTN